MAAIKRWNYYKDSGNNMQKQIRTTFPNLFYCSTKEPSESTSIVSSQKFPDTVARGCHSGLLKLQPVFFFFRQSKLCKAKSQHARSCSSRTINVVIFFFLRVFFLTGWSGESLANQGLQCSLMKKTDDDRCETLEAQLRWALWRSSLISIICSFSSF